MYLDHLYFWEYYKFHNMELWHIRTAKILLLHKNIVFRGGGAETKNYIMCTKKKEKILEFDYISN